MVVDKGWALEHLTPAAVERDVLALLDRAELLAPVELAAREALAAPGWQARQGQPRRRVHAQAHWVLAELAVRVILQVPPQRALIRPGVRAIHAVRWVAE